MAQVTGWDFRVYCIKGNVASSLSAGRLTIWSPESPWEKPGDPEASMFCGSPEHRIRVGSLINSPE